MKTTYFSFAFLICIFTAACNKISDNDINRQPAEVLMQNGEVIANKGWELFIKSAESKETENVLISPYSIHTALAMARNGAGSETEFEFQRFLQKAPYADLQSFNRAQKDLSALMRIQSGHPKLGIYNAFFYDDNRINVQQNFLSNLRESYDAQTIKSDFNQTDQALKQINDWVINSTKGRIKRVLDQIQSEDLAFLINAIHFKSDWSTAFDKQMTTTGSFNSTSGEIPDIQFMQADREITSYADEQLMLIDLPFRDSTYSISFIMPRSESTSVNSWLVQTNFSSIQKAWSNLTYGRILLTLPKFKLEYEEQLIPNLQGLGLETAFNPSLSDFSPMGNARIGPNIYISSVFHKAVLEIDEKGAEGAAVTSITFSTTSLPPSFRFDRPFVLLLRHIPTSTVLFAGKVEKPIQK
jgi:serine protease inhibitor